MPRPALHARKPVQARAVRRREAILDATARVLERRGWDGLTTNAVAREAKASIGTVYEYFASKEALLGGLLARHEIRLRAAIEQGLAQGGGDPLAAGDAVVEAFASVWRGEPGYRAAWSATQTGGLVRRAGDAWASAFVARVGLVLRGLFPNVAPRTARVVARTAVHLVSGLLLAAMAGPAREERSMIVETKRALRAYLIASLIA
jgi:AcrR family transcriptional regulator